MLSPISAAAPEANTMAPLGAGTVPWTSRMAVASIAGSAPRAQKLAARGTGVGRELRVPPGGVEGGVMRGMPRA
jgi:hypothetical protein